MEMINLPKLLRKFCGAYLLLIAPTLVAVENNPFEKFNCDTPNSSLSISFNNVDTLLVSSVLDMGRSKRTKAKRVVPAHGTRLIQNVNASTDNEGNRFSYELFNSDKSRKSLAKVLEGLESIPQKKSLCLFNKQDQLAYWLNLHNVALLKEIVKLYPRRNLQDFLSGDNSVLNKKSLTVEDVAVSINDIRSYILPMKYGRDPLILYGLYQGTIGGPDILTQAFTAKNVYRLLKSSAADFINSNRGTQYNSGDTLRVSAYYQWNAQYFSDFQNDLKQHILKFAEGNIVQDIEQSTLLEPEIENWKVTDLYGTVITFAQSVSPMDLELLSPQFVAFLNRGRGLSKDLSSDQIERLKSLMVIRAKNLGSTSVTVSDIELEDENK